MKAWATMWNGIRKQWMMRPDEKPSEPVDEIKLIQMAGEEVAAARNIYSAVEDPEMVEWAVYKLTAAEKRYDYLLKKYRQKK